jgi:hypothetical protein
MGEYKYVNKKLVGGKPKRIYKKQGSNKQYLKNNGKMMRVTEYRKKVSNNKKGGTIFGSVDGTIKDLKRIDIGTYQGFKTQTGIIDTKNAKKSLKVILKKENGETINSNKFTGFVDFPAIEIKPDGSISANIILVIFQNNNNEMLKNAEKIHQLYQKLDTVLSTREESKVSETVANIKNKKKTDTICSITDVKYTGDRYIDAQEFRNMSNDKIKSTFKTKLNNVGVDEKNTKVFYIDNIKFTSANCKELQALIETGIQVHPMLPKMATTTTDKFYRGSTPFLKVMVPSIWYTSSISLDNIDEHKKLQFEIFEKLINFAEFKKRIFEKYHRVLYPATGFAGVAKGSIWTYLGIVAPAAGISAFFTVIGPAAFAVTIYTGYNYYMMNKKFSKINKDNIDSTKRMISGMQNKNSNDISKIFFPQSLQRPQQQPQRTPSQQQYLQRAPGQQPRIVQPQQQPLMQGALSLFGRRSNIIVTKGGKLKKKKTAKKKQKK